MPLRWTTIIEAWEPPHRFVDTQLQGPYRLWHHTHTFKAQMGGTLIRDQVRYRLPLGWLGVVLHRLGIRRDLEAIFDDRARRVRSFSDPVGARVRSRGRAWDDDQRPGGPTHDPDRFRATPVLYQVRKIRALLFHGLCRLGKIDWASESHQELDRCLSRTITASKNFND